MGVCLTTKMKYKTDAQKILNEFVKPELESPDEHRDTNMDLADIVVEYVWRLPSPSPASIETPTPIEKVLVKKRQEYQCPTPQCHNYPGSIKCVSMRRSPEHTTSQFCIFCYLEVIRQFKEQ